MDIAANIRPTPPARFRNLAYPAAPGAPVAPETPVIRRRFRGVSVSLYEWQCGGHGSPHPAEEWAAAHEVVVARRGAFLWEIAGTRILADPGTVSFFHPGESYRVRHPLPGGDAGSVFRLPPSGVIALAEEHDPAAADRGPARFPTSHAPLDGRAYLLHRLAMDAVSDPAATALEVEERALAFVREAVAQAFRRRQAVGRAGRGRLASEYAARVMEVVAARYREPLTLAEVAGTVGASPFHLSRLVTAATGVPIYRMVLRRRLRDALELLLETRESISQIALSVGFASHSHLTDAFRREFGVPPRAVRRSGRGAQGVVAGLRAPGR
jgi:AraC-like DNA-binding protein